MEQIRSINGEDELILWVYLDRESDGRYGGAIRESSYGSESQAAGETIAEAVEEALSWAGVEGFSVPGTSTLAEVREALRTASSNADFDLAVRLYTSF